MLGPTKANLGDFATVYVPEGYRFTDAKGAAILLQRMKNPVPRKLVGLLAPDSGQSWVVLDYSDAGYLKDLSRKSQVDAGFVLRSVRERLGDENARRVRQGVQPIAVLDWVVRPVFDPSQWTLEWALRAEIRTEKIVNLQEETETNAVVNHTIRLIGKQRILGLTAVRLEQMPSESIPLKELAKGISFNPGERYSDYREGDKLAKCTLEELIVGEESQIPASPYVTAGIWTGVGLLAVGIIVAGIVVFVRKLRRIRMSRAYPDYEEHEHALSSLYRNGKARSNNGSRRRRSFNYQKFYSDMMLEVSSGPLILQLAPNGKQVPQRPTERLSPDESPANHTVFRANMELIANQNHLIEEQKRLMHEQGRLIEEKSRLIREKTLLLEKQAEFLERDLL
jgi:uncharacterized membrane-anchored protein